MRNAMSSMPSFTASKKQLALIGAWLASFGLRCQPSCETAQLLGWKASLL